MKNLERKGLCLKMADGETDLPTDTYCGKLMVWVVLLESPSEAPTLAWCAWVCA